MSEPIKYGLFPITDRSSAVAARRFARISIQAAPKRFNKLQIEEAERQFRQHWKRRLRDLGLTDLPEDPFENMSPEGG